MKTETVSIELTSQQCEAMEKLGRILWPDQKLELPELCRRLLLEGAESLTGGEQYPGEPEPEKLLADKDQATGSSRFLELVERNGKIVKVIDHSAASIYQ